MSKPKVVSVKHPPKVKKPRVVKEEDFSLFGDKPTAEMREEQYNDLKPRLLKPGSRLTAGEDGRRAGEAGGDGEWNEGLRKEVLTEEELQKRIEEDKKKRKGGLLGRILG